MKLGNAHWPPTLGCKTCFNPPRCGGSERHDAPVKFTARKSIVVQIQNVSLLRRCVLPLLCSIACGSVYSTIMKLSILGVAAPAAAKVLTYSQTSGGFHSPARGWNSFGLQANDVGANFTFNQDQVIAQCDILASNVQLKASNYTYCSLDSGWSVGGNGDDNGRIIYDAPNFDIPKLADHLHSKGLKLGLYVVPGAFQADLNKTILGTNTKIREVCSGDEGLARCVFDYSRPEVQTWHNSVVAQFASW